MEILKGTTYFDKFKLGKQYPYLNKDVKCDILIIGGGIDGAIVNYYLSKKFKTILIDKARFGLGDTVAATALLEYQLDDFAEDLNKELSKSEVEKIYKLGLESINKISNISKQIGNDFDFKRKPSFVYSNLSKDIESFKKEYNFRKSCGLKCELFTKETNPFPFDIEVGIYCEDGGAELNPYLFTHSLLKNSSGKKYENTEAFAVEKNGDGLVCITNYGYKIFCKKVVYTTGFNESLISKKSLSEKYVSYSIVTNPINELTWESDALIQDFMEPYHYLRKLPDGRLIFGGEDTVYKGKIDDNLAGKKYEVLLENLEKLFPAFKDKIKAEYCFCGLFASTSNNLGIISKISLENAFIFSSCGANGIINAFFGVELLLDLFENKNNWLEKIFSIERKIY